MDEYFRCMSSDQRQAAAQQAGALAIEHFNKGYNCAESTLYGMAKALQLPLPDAVMQAATAFGGGMGRAGGTCGALSGAVMALGLIYGRTLPNAEKKTIAYTHAERVYRRFVERAGAQDCRNLNVVGFGHPDQHAQCTRFVGIGAEVAAMELLGL